MAASLSRHSIRQQAGIGEFFDISMAAPPGSLVALLGSLGQGPTATSFGTFCLDLPPIVIFTFAMSGRGERGFHRYIPCDPNYVGITGYLQFLGMDENCNPIDISNQASLMIFDNGACM